MVATRRGSVDEPSAGKSPSDTNNESTGGQEEPRKLRGSGPSAGDTESGKRSASPADLPEVTSAKRQKTDNPEPVEKTAENTETVEPKDLGENQTAAPLDDKPPNPLLEVKDEVLEEAPGAQEKLEEGGSPELPPAAPQPGGRNSAATKVGNFDDLHLRMQLMRARQETEALGKPLIGASAGPLRDQKWGDLISQYPEHPDAVLFGICFTIGRSKSCNLRLPDSDVSGMLARLYLRGNAVYFENLGGTGTVALNGRDCKRGDKTVLKSGDELAFSGSKQFAYIFQQRPVNLAQAARLGVSLPSRGLGDSSERMVMMSIPRPPPTPIGDMLERLSKMPPPRSPRENSSPRMPLLGRAPSPALNEACLSRMRMLEEEKEALRQYVEKLESFKEGLVEGIRKGFTEGDAEKEAGRNAGEEGRNAPPRNQSFEALLQAAGEASKSREAEGGEKDEAGNVGVEVAGRTVLEDTKPEGGPGEGPEKTLQQDDDPPAQEVPMPDGQNSPKPGKGVSERLAQEKVVEEVAAVKRAALRESFNKAFVDPSEATVSFANFPYYLSETTKQLLIGSAYVHLKRSEFVKYTGQLAALSPRMLLVGGGGTEIYQETLVRALAVHFGAKLLVMDAGTEQEALAGAGNEEAVEAVFERSPETAAEREDIAVDPAPADRKQPVQDAEGCPEVDRELQDSTLAGVDQMKVDETPPTWADEPTEPPPQNNSQHAELLAEAQPRNTSNQEANPLETPSQMEIVREPGEENQAAIEPQATSNDPVKLETAPSTSNITPGKASEIPEASPGEAEAANRGTEKGPRDALGGPGGSLRVSGDTGAVPGESAKLPGELKAGPGVSGTVLEESHLAPGERTRGETEEEQVAAFVDESNDEGKEEMDEIWGRTLSNLQTVERSLSGLLATTRPEEEGKGDKPRQGKEAKKSFKKGDRVRFCGGPGATGVTSSLHTYLCGLAAEKQLKTDPPIRGPCMGCRGTVELVYSPNHKVGVRFDKAVPGGSNLGSRCEDGHGFWCNASSLELLESVEGVDTEGLRMDCLFEVLSEESQRGPVILHIKDAERSIMGNLDKYLALRKKLETLQGPIVAIASYTMPDAGKDKVHTGGSALHKFGGQQLLDLSFFNTLSRLEERGKEPPKIAKVLEKLFPSKIKIQPPQKDAELHEWKKQIEKDVATLRAESNRAVVRKVLKDARVGCEDLGALEIKDQILTPDQAQKVIGWGASHYLMMTDDPVVKKGRLQVSVESLRSGVELLRSVYEEGSSLKNSLKDIVLEDDFEKRLLSEVIPAEEIGVEFDDIGALESVKETLKELVMLPLQRPELFSRGQLTRPTKGILLFGPPGTGKTMLAKAVATEAGANFINISMATIASKWFGEGEKYVKAVFTLASKLAPSIVFIDEVDSMLGRREKPGEHEAMRKIKNEFMANWDGLKTKDRERVLVLAATNRPFDLDEAVVRRMPRRLMVSLPDAENRRKILQVILLKEELSDDFDFVELSQMTDGYSGSDLKNLCVTAAYQPIREILEGEKKEQKKAKAEGRPWVTPSSQNPPKIRPLSMKDMRLAREQVCASVSADAASSTELEQWNEQYGEGGSRQKTQLTYFM